MTMNYNRPVKAARKSATSKPNTRNRGQTGKRNSDKDTDKKTRRTRRLDTIQPDVDMEPKQNEAEKVMQHLLSMEKAANSLRKLVYEFLLKKMHVVLRQEDSLKGARACLKRQLPSQYSSLCRKLNAAYVEIELDIKHGKWSVNTLLEFFRYVEDDWRIILDYLKSNTTVRPPSVEDFKAKCEQLLAQDKIRLKNSSNKENISEKSYSRIMECLPNVTGDMLDNLYTEIGNRLDSETQPSTLNKSGDSDFE